MRGDFFHVLLRTPRSAATAAPLLPATTTTPHAGVYSPLWTRHSSAMSTAACAPTRAGMQPFAEQEGAADGGQEGWVDTQLWLACAGSMCTVPPVGAAVYYFPQGHAEQAGAAVDQSAAQVPPLVPCRVVAVRFMADRESDEVFAKMRLVPLRPGEPVVDVGEAAAEAMRGGAGEDQAKPASFAKTLTQSDANNGGGFSVPRFCAETIFPELDYRAQPPVQNVVARDVHGAEWTFRHIYRGTPRRHLLTTGWSHFVNRKQLHAGDSIVFLRGEDGQVRIGLRRAKRGGFGVGGGDEGPCAMSGWDLCRGTARGNATSSPGGGGTHSNNKVPAEDVLRAARLAASGQPFEVVHYPRASSPEFCVRAAAVRAAMQVQWCPGMRFKMAFETEDSSRISWFMGTVAGVQVADPARWPQSPWRLLQVSWDEPDLLQNVKRVCPWLVELVSSMPNLHLPSFSPPRKKPRILPYTEFPMEGQLFDPAFAPHPLPLHHDQSYNHGMVPFFPFPESSAAAGIQGARHAQFGSSFLDLHISNLQQGMLLSGIPAAQSAGNTITNTDHHHSPPAQRISTDLTIGSPAARRQDAPSCSLSSAGGAKKPDDDAKQAQGIVLFGQTILTEEQIKGSTSNTSGGRSSPAGTGSKTTDSDGDKAPNASEGSGSGVIQGSPPKTSSSSWRLHWSGDNGSQQSSSELGLEPGGQRKVHVGDESFSAFVKPAQRSTMPTDAGSDTIGG